MKQSKISLSIDEATLKRGRIMAATQNKSFSKMVEDMLNDAYDVKSIISDVTASEVTANTTATMTLSHGAATQSKSKRNYSGGAATPEEV